MLEKNKFVMIDNSCQTNDQTANERWGLNTVQDHSCTWDQVSTDIESLKSKMSTLQSSVLSFENILKDHDTILSALYNRAADLNEKHLVEINEKTRYINYLEQKLTKVEEERDSLQLATRLIAHPYG
jgi:predicted  nucleic acid-binding Zn-ribbon protein